MKKPMTERTSMIWNTLSSRVVSRPAIATISIRESQPAIHSAALGLEGVRSIGTGCQIYLVDRANGGAEGWGGRGRYRRPRADLQLANMPMHRCTGLNFGVRATARSVLWNASIRARSFGPFRK